MANQFSAFQDIFLFHYVVTEENIDGLNLYILEHVQLFITITHPRRGDLEIVLICPSSTHSILATPRKVDL